MDGDVCEPKNSELSAKHFESTENIHPSRALLLTLSISIQVKLSTGAQLESLHFVAI